MVIGILANVSNYLREDPAVSIPSNASAAKTDFTQRPPRSRRENLLIIFFAIFVIFA
jgi:hypothetical protein